MGSGSGSAGRVVLIQHGATGAQAWLVSASANLSAAFWESDVRDPAPVGPVALAADTPLAVWALEPQLWALAGTDRRITLLDLRTLTVPLVIDGPTSGEDIASVRLAGAGAQVLQLDRDGQFHLYTRADAAPLLSGRYVDDEVVIFDSALNYEATPEGAGFVHVKYPGDRYLYALSQLGAALQQTGLVQTTLDRPGGRAATLALPLPPRITVTAKTATSIEVLAEARGGLSHVALYRDGMEIARQAVSGAAAQVAFDLPAQPETRWFALRATDQGGLVSQTQLLPRATPVANAPGGRLFVLAVGTDLYDDPGISQLGFAASDAQAFASAFVPGGRYIAVEAEVVATSRDLAQDLFARTRALSARMTQEDTFFMHIAGHGFTDAQGRFQLARHGAKAGSG